MNTPRLARLLNFAASLVALLPCVALSQQSASTRYAGDVARGRYLVQIAGCNDCHTPGFAQTNGKVEERLWLTGDALGWRGPWGTTYPSNIRLYVQTLSESAWVTRWRVGEARPPMPWANLRAMTDADLRAMYRYVKHLGPAAGAAPAYVPPDQQPKTPVVVFPSPPPEAQQKPGAPHK
jgi:mono/diheme cytochrome c family protein